MTYLFRGSVSVSSIITDGSAVESANVSYPIVAGESNFHWQADRDVAAAGTDTLDLSALPVVVFGEDATVGFVSINSIWIRNTGEGPLEMDYGQMAVLLPVGAVAFYNLPSTGVSTAASGSSLVITATNASSSYEILIVGAKAQ
jgi:hypothetical protein